MEDIDRATVLSTGEVTRLVAERGLAWELDGGALATQVRGRDFAAALDYVNRVGALAEAMNHHPDIAISWNTVTLRLRTHSAGGITAADLELAGRIDGLGLPAT